MYIINLQIVTGDLEGIISDQNGQLEMQKIFFKANVQTQFPQISAKIKENQPSIITQWVKFQRLYKKKKKILSLFL